MAVTMAQYDAAWPEAREAAGIAATAPRRQTVRFVIRKRRIHRPWDGNGARVYWAIYLVHQGGTLAYITRYRKWSPALEHVNTALAKFGDRR